MYAREYRCVTERQGLNDTNFPQGIVKYCFLIFALMIAVGWTVALEDGNYPQTILKPKRIVRKCSVNKNCSFHWTSSLKQGVGKHTQSRINALREYRPRTNNGTERNELRHIWLCTCLRILLVTTSIPQSKFIKKGFKKTENVRHSLVLVLFLFTAEIKNLNAK